MSARHLEPATISATATLWQAAWHGRRDEARDAIERGASLDAADDRGMTPLAIAAAHGHDLVTELLLDAGAGVNGPTAEQPAALRLCCRSEGASGRWVAEPADPPVTEGVAPLAAACRGPEGEGPDPQRAPQIIASLLSRGARLSEGRRDDVAWAVFGASTLSDGVLAAILEVGASIDAAFSGLDERTALLHAAQHGLAADVGRLLARSADANRVDARGASAIGCALVSSRRAFGRSLDLERARKVDLLIESGADPDRGVVPIDARPVRPLLHVLASGSSADFSPTVVASLVRAGASTTRLRPPQRAQVAAALGEASALEAALAKLPPGDARARARARATAAACGHLGCVDAFPAGDGAAWALKEAAAYGHLAIVERLLSEVDDPRDQQLALQEAGKAGHVAIVKLLAARGAPLDYPTYPVAAPIRACVEEGQLACVEALLEAGADVGAVVYGNRPGSPFVAAVRRGDRAMVTRLLAAGIASAMDARLRESVIGWAREAGREAIVADLERHLGPPP